jgi:ribosome-associated protein
MTATEEALRLARVAAQAAADKLAKDILLVDVSDRLAITDVFVIVTGANERQVGAIVDSIEEKMREAGTRPPRREGERDGRWVLLDFVDVVVHVQHAEERVFYALDRLWKDCPAIPFVDASGDPTSVADTSKADDDGPVDAGVDSSDDSAVLADATLLLDDELAKDELESASFTTHVDPVGDLVSDGTAPDTAAHQLPVDSAELDAAVAALEPANPELPDQDGGTGSAGDRPGAVNLP